MMHEQRLEVATSDPGGGLNAIEPARESTIITKSQNCSVRTPSCDLKRGRHERGWLRAISSK